MIVQELSTSMMIGVARRREQREAGSHAAVDLSADDIRRTLRPFRVHDTAGCTEALDGGLDPNFADANGSTLLHHVTWKRNLTLIRLILSRGADANLADVYGNTPLHVASGMGDTKAVQVRARACSVLCGGEVGAGRGLL